MTPAEYVQLRQPIEEAIDRLRDAKLAMWESANQSPLPANLRPATADDIQPDAIIWYKHGDEHGYFWQIVDRPLYYGDSFKAYEAEDGCRYGLDDAWIEIGTGTKGDPAE